MSPFGSIPNVSGSLGTANPSYTFLASFLGWNYSQPSGSNPTISSANVFPGRNLNATAYSVDNQKHDLAYYQPGTTPNQVSPLDTCGPGNLCLAHVFVPNNGTRVTLQFAFPSAQTFELYCTYHAFDMHAKVFVNRSPDINGDHTVNIIDLATVGIAFGSTPSSSKWNPSADLNRDNATNIIDLVIVAVYFGQTV